MRFGLLFILVSACFFGGAGIDAAGGAGAGESAGVKEYDWAKWLGPNGNGVSSESGWVGYALAPAPRIVWSAEVGYGYSSVCIKGDHLYTMGHLDGADTVYCLDVETGGEVWTYTYPCVTGNYAGSRATPVYSESSVYTVSRAGEVFCFEPETGRVKWRKDLAAEGITEVSRWGISSSAIIEGDMLLLNAGKHGVAMDKRTGAVIWKSAKALPGYASPVLYDSGGRRCMVVFGQKALYGVAVESGELLWTKEWVTKLDENSSDPVVDGEDIFVSSIYSKGCSLFNVAGDTPREIWLNQSLVTKFSTSVLFEGDLYGIHGNTGRGTVRCVDFETGEVHWDEELEFASAIVVDAKLVIMGESGMLYIAKAAPDGYEELSRGRVLEAGDQNRRSKGKCWTAPVLCRGLIFCRNDQGRLVCVNVRK